MKPTLRQPLPPEIKAQFAAYRDAHDARPVQDGDLVSLPQVVAQIGGAMAEGRALSMVRLGDGEGGCLFGDHPDYPDLGPYVAIRSMELHFGRRTWTGGEVAALREDIAQAALQADIVTFARKAAVRARILAAPHPEARGHVGATYADHWLSDRRDRLRGAVYKDGYLHTALLPHYPDLLRGRDMVVLGCRGEAFAQRLAEAMGARLAEEIAIPGQWSNGDRNAVRLYPHALPAVRARLHDTARPGRVVLAAAGLCTKALCVEAAARGAVALDVGSVMDIWAGEGVRNYQGDAMVARYRI